MDKESGKKLLIAAAMKELMEHTPFAKITVNSIVERSGINRKTFYHHFKDKYELVNWIFSSEVAANVNDPCSLANWPERTLKLYNYWQDNKVFYAKLLKTLGQNSFYEYLYVFNCEQILIICREACGNRTFDQADFDFMVDFLSHAFFGVFTTWVNSGMQESPATIIKRLQAMVDNSVERLFVNLQAVGD